MEKQKAQEILSAAREREAIVSVYQSYYSINFSAGFVSAFSDDEVVIESLTPRGQCSGWLSRKFDNIVRIDTGGRYEETLLSLHRARGGKHRADFLPTLDLTSNVRVEMLLAAREHDYAVRIDTGAEEDIRGFVREVGPETVSIEKFNLHGQSDGDCTLDMDIIDGIYVDDDELQDLKLLARWHDMPPV